MQYQALFKSARCGIAVLSGAVAVDGSSIGADIGPTCPKHEPNRITLKAYVAPLATADFAAAAVR